MYNRSLPLIALALLACRGNGEPAAPTSDAAALEVTPILAAGRRVVEFPAEDPGPPLYARITPIMNQIFVDDGFVAIPIYRDPACVPPDTDLLEHLHLPGPAGPGAFACELLIEGRYIVEADAPIGTFPIRVVARGPAQIWFIEWTAYEAATADGDLTMAELIGLQPLRGTATTFHEMLSPRLDNHHVVITSRGRLHDGRSFRFNLNHLGDETQSILIGID